MIEIRDTFRGGEDAEIKTLKASRWKGIEMGGIRHPTIGFGGAF